MAEMTKPDLDAVFLGGEAAPPPMDDATAPPVDDGAEVEEALDAAIDEAFDSTDPEARREAFKRAMRLCSESSYGH